MAADASIYNALTQTRIDSPFEAQAKAAQLQSGIAQNRLQQLQLQGAEREFASDNALAGLISSGATPEQVASGLAGQGYGKQSLAYSKQAAEQARAARQAESEQFKQAMEKQAVIAQYAGSAKDQASWSANRAALAQMGVDVSQVPEQYDPAIAQQLQQRALTGVQQLEQVWKQKGFDLDREKFGYQKSNDAANRGVTIRGQNMTDARSRELAAATGGGKAPPGYRFTQDGNLEAIPGGPADIKAGEAGAKREKQIQGSIASAERVLGTVRGAMNRVGNTTAGFAGSTLAKIPGTAARDLASDVETIKANLGFDRLQQMRDESPTGGALGAIAVQELVALQSTVASLDTAQSPEQLRRNLKKIDEHYTNWLQTIKGEKPKGVSTPKEQNVFDAADAILNGGK